MEDIQKPCGCQEPKEKEPCGCHHHQETKPCGCEDVNQPYLSTNTAKFITKTVVFMICWALLFKALNLDK